MTTPAPISDFDHALDAVCTAHLGGPLKNCARLSGGASQESYSFTCADETFVLRRPPGGIAKTSGSNALSMTDEARALQYVHAAGVRVPEVVYICQPDDGLGPGYVMRFIAGQTIARKILRDEAFAPVRPQLAAQCGQMLARLHALDETQIAGLPHSDARGELEKYTKILRDHGHPHPVFELAIRWLGDRVPEATTTRLVHGDFRLGNLMVRPEDGVVALLDWELAHTGDPMEDLGWPCVPSWRFGQHQNPVGGFGQREEFYAAYEAAGGSVDRDAVRFWEILGTLKWGIMCTMMATAFISGTDRSVERASIGRRASETEIDLLRMLEGQD
ncbi:MAG: phosphotransferase family protein [PS1 clade bacterium]|nr:phosphotransferase family protein [PS1 clade bacterium]